MADFLLSGRFLWTVALVLAASTALLFLWVMGRAWRAERWERSTTPLLKQGRVVLARALAEGALPAEDELFLRRLPSRLQVRLLVTLAPSLGGESRNNLRQLADDLGVRAFAERLTGSRSWWDRLEGLRLLTAVGGGETVVPGLVSDPVGAVRAQAAEWLAEHAPGVGAPHLLEMLADRDPLCRFAAKDGLHRMGPAAVTAVRVGLGTPDARVLAAALEVACANADPSYLPYALELAHHAHPTVRQRAAPLLASLGGAPAAAALQTLLADPEPRVREAAARGLGGVGGWDTAPALAALLGDDAWDVRRAAAEALGALGSPGRMLLQRASRGTDRAGDAARLALASSAVAPGGGR